MFALTDGSADADGILTAMTAASRSGGVNAGGWVAAVDTEGVRTVER